MNKKKIAIIILSVLSVLVLSIKFYIVKADCITPIKFKDSNLERGIRLKIHKPDGDIFKIDVENVTSLGETEFYNIKSLNGIENLTNLTSLTLWDNRISELSPLKHLTKLTRLELFNNKISDIRPLKGLTKLKALDLRQNKISNLNAL
jgi:Leucine-rich repeat (LRR) protein